MTGTVTNPTGSIGGKSMTGLVDAETQFSGIVDPIGTTKAQWQMTAVLSDKTGVCSRLVNGLQTYLANELTLLLQITGWKDTGSAPPAPPASDVPFTLTYPDPSPDFVTSDGVHRVIRPFFQQASKSGRAGNAILCTSGTVAFSAVSTADPNKGQSGSYDLYFGADHVTGSFVAPWCGTGP